MFRAAVLTDLSTIGNCSGSVSIAVMSAMGVEVCLIPTAILSAQTGFGNSCIIDTSPYLNDYINSVCNTAPGFDAVYIGFMNNMNSCAAAKKLIESCRDAAVIVDPISGDCGRRFGFMDERLYDFVAENARLADIITPNLTELCLLTDSCYDDLISLNEDDMIHQITMMCNKYISQNRGTVVVTGIDCGEFIANLTADSENVSVIKAQRFGGSMSGTGDILCSIVCAAAAKGENIHSAVQLSGEFISEVMKGADPSADRNFGIPYQNKLYLLCDKTKKDVS